MFLNKFIITALFLTFEANCMFKKEHFYLPVLIPYDDYDPYNPESSCVLNSIYSNILPEKIYNEKNQYLMGQIPLEEALIIDEIVSESNKEKVSTLGQIDDQEDSADEEDMRLKSLQPNKEKIKIKKPKDKKLFIIINQKTNEYWYVCKECGKNMFDERYHECFDFEEWCSSHKLSYEAIIKNKK